MFLEKIIINKSGGKGEATVYLANDEGLDLILNKFQIDISDGSSPVSVLKANGVPVISGSIVEHFKEELLEMFNSIRKYKVGMFEFTEEGVCKIGE